MNNAEWEQVFGRAVLSALKDNEEYIAELASQSVESLAVDVAIQTAKERLRQNEKFQSAINKCVDELSTGEELRSILRSQIGHSIGSFLTHYLLTELRCSINSNQLRDIKQLLREKYGMEIP
jgi:hypothetical protein